MRDSNGQELAQGDLCALLCRIEELNPDGIRVRILNSELELNVSWKVRDEVNGFVAATELQKIATPAAADQEQPKNV